MTPAEFDEIGQLALSLGFKSVASAPLVRSSFKAKDFYEDAVARMTKSTENQ